MATIGKLHDLTTEFKFEWQIEDFFSLDKEIDKVFRSPDFSFAGESWHLGIYPNGQSKAHSAAYIGLYLTKKSRDPAINLEWCFSLKTFNGKNDREHHASHVYEKKSINSWGYPMFIKTSELLEKKSELVPSDVLTIIFSVIYWSRCNENAGNTERAKCTHCKKVTVAECLSAHEQKCMEKPIRCPMCKDEVTLKMWIDHECETARVKANEKLINDLAALIDNGEQSDVTIKVKDEEFQLHWSILAGRNPYFSSMVKAEMKEVTTGIITIHDCEPDIFRSFIYFLYTGKLETLSSGNVCALYKVADKYQEDQVKAECLNFMKKRISVENFCDFVVLALTHDEKDLLTDATEFFCKSVQEVLPSVKWQTFMREYPTQANELNIKAFNFYINK